MLVWLVQIHASICSFTRSHGRACSYYTLFLPSSSSSSFLYSRSPCVCCVLAITQAHFTVTNTTCACVCIYLSALLLNVCMLHCNIYPRNNQTCILYAFFDFYSRFLFAFIYILLICVCVYVSMARCTNCCMLVIWRNNSRHNTNTNTNDKD